MTSNAVYKPSFILLVGITKDAKFSPRLFLDYTIIDAVHDKCVDNGETLASWRMNENR